MFGLFNKKRKNEKLRLICRANSVIGDLKAQNCFSAISKLDYAILKLDDASSDLTDEQVRFIDDALDIISNHCSKMYEPLIINKCDRIMECICNKCMDFDGKYLESEDRLYKKMSEIEKTSKEVEDYKRKMDEQLGKNKSLWSMYNASKKRLEAKLINLNNDYNRLLKVITNIDIVGNINSSRDEADEIADLDEEVDVDDVKDSVDYITKVGEDVDSKSREIENIMFSSIGTSGADSEYDRALEEKNMSKKSTCNKGKKVVGK